LDCNLHGQAHLYRVFVQRYKLNTLNYDDKLHRFKHIIFESRYKVQSTELRIDAKKKNSQTIRYLFGAWSVLGIIRLFTI
jgi:hypothetical protein